MEMAAAAICVEDYEEAGLVLSAAELVEATEKTAEMSVGVDQKGKQPQGIIIAMANNKAGGDDDDDTQQAPEMATDDKCAGDKKKGKTEWEIEMESTVMGKTEDQWPGLWEFERDECYFQWILYCPDHPDAFVLDSH